MYNFKLSFRVMSDFQPAFHESQTLIKEARLYP